MSSYTRLLIISITLLASESTLAANPKFQEFFFALCSNPSGQLAARCNETTGGLGDLSGDSESSLNPSQPLGSLAGSRNSSEQRNAAVQPLDGLAESIELDLGPISLLLNGRFSTEELRRDVNTDSNRGYDLENYGLQIGLDYRFSDNLVVGALTLWESSQLEFDREIPGRNFAPTGNAGKVETQSYGIAVFVSRDWSNGFFANATLTYLDSDIDFERRAVFQESNRAVAATYVLTQASGDGRSISVSTSVERTMQYGRWSLTPFGGLNYQSLAVDGYTERDLSSSGLALQVRGERSTKLDSLVGLRASAVFSRDQFVWIPHLRLQTTYSFNAQRSDAEVVFVQDASQQTFRLQGDSPDKSFFDLGVGSALIFSNGMSAFVEVQTTLGRKDLNAYRLNAGIRLEF